MPHDEPKTPDAHDPAPSGRDAFDPRALGAMPDEEADAEWLRRPEAWHLH